MPLLFSYGRFAILATLLLAVPASAEIVRIHDLTPAQLGKLRVQYDYWGRDRDAGAAVFRLSERQRGRAEEGREGLHRRVTVPCAPPRVVAPTKSPTKLR